MSRSEVLLFALVGALAVFVGVQVANRPVSPPVTRVEAGSAQGDQPRKTDPELRTVVVARTPRSRPDSAASSASSADRTAPAVDRASLIAGTTGTYMSDMLIDLKGQLVRWPDRRETGLRVWVQAATSIHDWDLRYAQMARNSFTDWSGSLPIRFDFVLDSATSDVQIVWIDRFPPEFGARVGTTNRSNDRDGWLVKAQIVIAVHDSAGREIPPSGLAGIVRHEAGHALGLGHSRDPKTKMYPVEMVNDISPADRATLRLLYQLPPGAIR